MKKNDGKKYTVTYKVAEGGTQYIYQEDKGKYKEGEPHKSFAGHMWYVLEDGQEEPISRGFESENEKSFDKGHLADKDDAAYQDVAYQVKLELTADQYNKLKAFSKDPSLGGFDKNRYNVLTNNCVDFVFKSLSVIGYVEPDYKYVLTPKANIVTACNKLKQNGANIISNQLKRDGEYYEENGENKVYCQWLDLDNPPLGIYGTQVSKMKPFYHAPEKTPPVTDKTSLINIEITPSPQARQQITDVNKVQQDIGSGFICSTATFNVFALTGILDKTDFVSTQLASLATGGIRPGEVQRVDNPQPNRYLGPYYQRDTLSDCTFSLFQAVTNNGLSALMTKNTYVDPLLLDLSGNGVHMTDITDGVLFDTDHSGTLKRSGWADRQSGMLVIDNGSGEILDVSQMFSEFYRGKAGENGTAGERRFSDGFAALASEDSNHDGVIDQQDDIWQQLRVWVDSNHDGKVDAGELKTLADTGISAIYVNSQQSSEMRDGNQVLASGSFLLNGEKREMLAVDFVGDPVSNRVSEEEKGKRVISTAMGITTTAFVSESENDETLDATQLEVSNLYGGKGNDTLIAAASGSWLVGGAGSNHYIGGAGNDVFVISASDDVHNIHGNGGLDTAIIVGRQGVKLNMAEAGLTLAEGGSGNDTIISGGSRGVFIRGGSGDSLLIGGMGTDVLSGGSGHNTIIGGSGKAVIYAGPQGDTIYASGEGSVIYAGGGDDMIFGGPGDDVIEAGNGNAVIDGDGGINLVNLHGNYGDYRITRTDSGFQVEDKVAGRDGMLTLKNIQKLNFADISAVDLQLPNAMPVADVLTHNTSGKAFNRTQAQRISADSLLANDQRLNSQGALRIACVEAAVGGSVCLTAQGDVLFTPDPAYRGLMSFKYGVADAAGNLSALVEDLNSGELAPMRATVSLLTPEVPLDPLAVQEWYLSDCNILPVWQDFSGRGVRIGQFEPGGKFATGPEIFDIHHPDLAANVDHAWLESEQQKQGLPTLTSNHATMVAGVMVAAKNNLGGVGVAYDATLGGYYLANDGADLAGLGHMVSFDIANNSWGFTQDFALSNFQDGCVDTAAGGNQRAKGGSSQGSLTSNNRFSVEVGAINAQGDLSTLQSGSAPFSNPGASLLISAPGSNIVSTSQMLKTERGSTFGSDYSSMQGTSFAAPIVSGIVALMLEANPNLGYRDVQQILALSARKINDPTTEWQDNHRYGWNGGGMHTSHDYGFGLVDARAAVRLAETWMTQSTAANEYVYSASSGPVGKTLAAGATLTSSLTMQGGLNIEHVEVDFDADVGRLGDLALKLISPDGTESVLLDRPGKVPEGMPGASADDTGSQRSGSFRYSFMSTHDLGERSQGNWTLQMTDASTGLPATLNDWSLRLYGSKRTPDNTYFYTDEYAPLASGQASRAVLNDTINAVSGGRNTLNAAAVSRDTTVNLQTGVASIGGAALTIKHPADIQNIITGEGNDLLVAGDADALLDGGRGNNILVGGAGRDFFVVHRREAGSDIIRNFEAARGETISLVGFSGKTFADLQLSQQGDDVKVGLGKNQSITLEKQALTGIGVANFQFQDTFIAPKTYTSSDPATHLAQEGLGTVQLKGGGKGVRLSCNDQGQLIFSLSGTIYSHDSATSDTFVVAAQPDVKDYRNALRGFRHGIDKIDLRQVGITDFSQLAIRQVNRGTINGVSQIHGTEVISKADADAEVTLLYLDTLETSQLSENDFLFAESVPDLVPAIDPAVGGSSAASTLSVADQPVADDFYREDVTPAEPLAPAWSEPLPPLQSEPLPLQNMKPPELYQKPDVTLPGLAKKPVSEVAEPAVIVSDSWGQLTLGDEHKTIRLEGFGNTLVAGNGNNNVMVTGSYAEITLGNGDNNITGTVSELDVGDGDNIVNIDHASFAKIKLGDGDNTVNIDHASFAKVTLGNGNNSLEITDSSFAKVKLGDGNNHVITRSDFTTIEAGHGTNDMAFMGYSSHLKLGKDISPEQLWFQHRDQDLYISVLGSQQTLTLHNWYADLPERPSDITTGGDAGNDYQLDRHHVENLVQAMAAFSPSPSASTIFSDAARQQLQPVLDSNWHLLAVYPH